MVSQFHSPHRRVDTIRHLERLPYRTLPDWCWYLFAQYLLPSSAKLNAPHLALETLVIERRGSLTNIRNR